MKRWLTPPAIAKQLGVHAEKVIGWIRAQELRASNVAQKATGRPRWRINPADLELFLAARSEPAVPAQSMRRRRRRQPDVIEFF
jgi:hypothetical protein